MQDIKTPDITDKAEDILQEIDLEMEKPTLTENSLYSLQQRILNKLHKMPKEMAQEILTKLWEATTPDRIKNEMEIIKQKD